MTQSTIPGTGATEGVAVERGANEGGAGQSGATAQAAADNRATVRTGVYNDESIAERARSARMGAASGAATLLTGAALLPVFVNSSWLPPAIAMVVVITLTGIGIRLLPRVAGLAPLAQLLAGFVVLNLFFAQQHLTLGIIPTPGSTRDLRAVLGEGLLDLQAQAAPVLLLDGLVALTAMAIGLAAILVEFLVIRMRRAALGGLAQLVIYLVPVATLVGMPSPISFLGPALGYLVLLYADGRDGVARWGRTVTSGNSRSLPGLVTAAQVGLGAVGLGLVLPLVIPTWPEGLLGEQFGGGGAGSGPGTSLSPLARLQGELTLPEARDLLRYETSVDDPYYLRSLALDTYGPDGWSLANLDSQVQVAGDGLLVRLPGPQILKTITADVTVLDHADRFLPVFSSPLSIEVAGDWRFDENSATVFSRDDTTAELEYSLRAQQPNPSRTQLARASDLDPDNPLQVDFTALPTGLDPAVAALVDSLVAAAGAGTPYERTLAINNYLTDSANGFLYSLTTEPGTSGDDLVNFLENKRGYCEQYAAAMAVMLRATGVPARVVLGYTPGTFEDGAWTVTTDDAHSWVEAYFSGFGWIPFDPTPIGPGRAVELGYAPRADSIADEETSAAPSVSPGQLPGGQAPQFDESLSDPNTLNRTTVQDGFNWVPIAIIGGLLIVLVALLAPALIRIRTRLRRIRLVGRSRAGPGAHAAWDELMDTATDLGLTSRQDETPRMLARRLARDAMFDADSAVAVRDIALAEERARYAPESVALSRSVDLAPPLRSARRALGRHAGRRQRLRARVMPASTVNRLRPSARSARRQTRPPGR
ncbi:MAG: transglutaminase domain-containing protein [Geodermatophilaceae bacterium]|nr:transglutaminase domain-containing protein [Geodermatophilaceae bacterium]